MSVSLVRNGPPLSKPVFILSIFLVSLALIATCLVVSGCTTSAPIIMGFYTASLSYNLDTSSINSSALQVTGMDQLLKSDSNGTGTFQSLRVGYRGVCLLYNATDSSNAAWHCSTHGGHPNDLGGDPLNLVSVGNIYRNKISFSIPLWCGVAFLSLTWLTLFPNLFSVQIPFIVRQLAALCNFVAMLLLLGAMVLHQVTTTAVEALVTRLDMNAVDIQRGAAVIVFGWGAFALATLACLFVGAMVAIEPPLERRRLKNMYGYDMDEAEREEKLMLKRMNSQTSQARRLREREEEELRELEKHEAAIAKIQKKEHARTLEEKKRALKEYKRDETAHRKAMREIERQEKLEEEERMLLARQRIEAPPPARVNTATRLIARSQSFRHSVIAASNRAFQRASPVPRAYDAGYARKAVGFADQGYRGAEMVHRGNEVFQAARPSQPVPQTPNEPYIRGVLHMGPNAEQTVFYADPNAKLQKNYKPPKGVTHIDGVQVSSTRWDQAERRLNGDAYY